MAGGVVLGEVGQPAVAHQPVAAGQAQGVALAGGEQRFRGVGEGFHEAHRMAGFVDAQQQPAGLLLLGWVGAVVEHRDHASRLELGVVLPVEGDPRPELEAAVVPTQAPADQPALQVHVVQRPHVARRQQHVAGAARDRPS